MERYPTLRPESASVRYASNAFRVSRYPSVKVAKSNNREHLLICLYLAYLRSCSQKVRNAEPTAMNPMKMDDTRKTSTISLQKYSRSKIRLKSIKLRKINSALLAVVSHILPPTLLEYSTFDDNRRLTETFDVLLVFCSNLWCKTIESNS